MNLWSFGLGLCFASLCTSALIHIATFALPRPALAAFLLVPFALLAGAIICERAVRSRRRLLSIGRGLQFFLVSGKPAVIGYLLLLYAVILFVHLYRTTGGASGVGTANGQYVYMYKSHVIRPITEREYKMFPVLVARMMSAWLGMMASFGMSSFVEKQGNLERKV